MGRLRRGWGGRRKSMATIKDIAKRAGVSHGTVSNVLNRRGNVSAEKIKLVEQAARELGYQINSQASKLRSGRSENICIIVPRMDLKRYGKLFTSIEAVKPYLVSIVYSLGAALLAALVSIVCVRFVQKSKNKLNKLFEYGALIPWLLPSTLIALGLTMAYGDRNSLIFNKVLVGTTVILLIGYVVIKLPFSYRMIRSAFFSVDEDLEDAAKCMGASTFYTMRKVIIPVILPAVLSVVILNFNGLLADYDLTAFLYHPLFQPLGIVVKAASDENASIDAKCMSFVYTVVLMILSSVALYFGQGNGMQAIRRWKQRRIEKKVYRK